MQDPLKNDEVNKGTDPIKNESVDLKAEDKSKAGESAFDEKVFEDPRLWTHPRFKSLSERAKKAELLEKEKADAEEKALEGAKEFKQLAEKAKKERDDIQQKFAQSLQDNRIISEASKIGVVDIDTVLKLIDRSAISTDANGNVVGAVQAVQELLAAKPFLKGKQTVTIGSPTNPNPEAEAGAKRFKLSQISNPVFYRENEKDIQKAYALGLIEDDVSK